MSVDGALAVLPIEQHTVRLWDLPKDWNRHYAVAR